MKRAFVEMIIFLFILGLGVPAVAVRVPDEQPDSAVAEPEQGVQGSLVRIESLSCTNVPNFVMQKVMQGVWTDTGASCISCMACGCTCIAQGVYVMDSYRIDATRVSCEGKSYTLVVGNQSYKCESIAVKPTDAEKHYGGEPLRKCDPESKDWDPQCFYYPGARMVSDSGNEIHFDGEETHLYGYGWQVFVTTDDFAQVNDFYRRMLGQEVRAVMANGKPMAVFPIRADNSSITVTSDANAGKVYITVFKYEYTLE